MRVSENHSLDFRMTLYTLAGKTIVRYLV